MAEGRLRAQPDAFAAFADVAIAGALVLQPTAARLTKVKALTPFPEALLLVWGVLFWRNELVSEVGPAG